MEQCKALLSEERLLDVMVQVNTSGEESKHGVAPGENVVDLAKHIRDNCKELKLIGLMTIGMPDYTSKPENFDCLKEERKRVCDKGRSRRGLRARVRVVHGHEWGF